MKRALYDLTDEEFVTLLERTHIAFGNAKIPYMFVGGVAVQAHIADCLCRNGKNLADFANSPDFRVQDHLRATDDVDITLSRKAESDDVSFANKIYAVLNDIVGKEGGYISPTGEHLVFASLERKGLSRPIFRLGLNGEGDINSAVSFNLYKGAEDTNERWPFDIRDFERRYYETFIERAVDIEIPFCSGKKIHLRIKNAEDLLATKIVRGRDKDLSDVLSLAHHRANAGNPINYEAIKGILCADDPRYGIPNASFMEKYEQFMNVLSKWK